MKTKVAALCALLLLTVGVPTVALGQSARVERTTHTVKAGDNDSKIARAHGLTVEQLHRLNPGVKWTRLQIGQRIVVAERRVRAQASRPASRPAARPVSSAGRRTVEFIRDDVNLRREPSTGSELVTRIDKGRTAVVLESRGGWHKVQFSGGTVGWVRGDMVRVSAPAAARPASASASAATSGGSSAASGGRASGPAGGSGAEVEELPVTPVIGQRPAAESTSVVSGGAVAVSSPAASESAPAGAGEARAASSVPLRVRITMDDVIVRKDASTSSERLAKVTKGRLADVLALKNGWYKVKFSGGTVGWVRGDLVEAASADAREPVRVASAPSRRTPAASSAAAPRRAASPAAAALLDTAKDQLGVRYVFGGTSRNGFDCSGFVRFVFAKHGVRLPRTSIEQSRVGSAVPRNQLRPGDMVFFITRGSRVSHVGIYIGGNRFIHASSGGGRVRIDGLGEAYYNRRYAGARRVGGFNAAKVVEDAKAEVGQKAVPEEEEGPVLPPVSGAGPLTTTAG